MAVVSCHPNVRPSVLISDIRDRPATDEGRPLSWLEFADYCVTHDFRLPCCFCGILDATPGLYVESILYSLEGERFLGCKRNRCGYEGTRNLPNITARCVQRVSSSSH